MTQVNNENSVPNPSLTDNWRPRLRRGLRTERIGAELVLLDRAAKKVHQLDAMGTRILDLCDGEHNALDIATCLATRYDATEKRVQRDVAEFLRQLFAAGVID